LVPQTTSPQGNSLNQGSVVLVDDHRVVTRSLKAWLESFPDMKVVGIAASGEEVPETPLAAVRAVAAGRTYIDPSLANQIFLRPPSADEVLTPREMEVLRLLAPGRSNKEIATSLSIGEETAKSHVSSVFGKPQVENRAQAVVRDQATDRGVRGIGIASNKGLMGGQPAAS
jgi:DNA-binding NarL/FixJ family response regulator